MGKITIEVKINTFGNMLYGLNHPTVYSRYIPICVIPYIFLAVNAREILKN